MALPRSLRSCLRAACLVVAAATFGAACSKSPAAPTPPPPVAFDAPGLVCPSDSTVDGVVGGGQAVSFPAPALTGGTPPVVVTCTPNTGSPFPLGPTNVVCTARDSVN